MALGLKEFEERLPYFCRLHLEPFIAERISRTAFSMPTSIERAMML